MGIFYLFDNKIQKSNLGNGVNPNPYGLVVSTLCGVEIRVKDASTKARVKFVKYGGRMPAKAVIVNGPGVKQFIFCSKMFGGPCNLLQFHIRIFNKPPVLVDLEIFSQGKSWRGSFDGDEDEYCFIGISGKLGYERHPVNGLQSCMIRTYYVGVYNTNTREGKCVIFTEGEFTTSTLGKAVLGRFDELEKESF